jgi:ABC-type glycerol-3-phosphate transport system substrate-binding protein
VGQLVSKSDAGTVEKGGIALGSYSNIGSAKDILATLILQAGGNITGLDSENILRSQLASQKSSTATVTALDFYTEFADPSQPDYSWSRAFQNAQASFAAGDVAMYVGHASEYASINKANPNLNFAMAPLPQIRTGTYAMDTSHVYALAVSRNSKNASGALTVALLLAAQNFITPVAKSLGMATALRQIVEAGAVSPKPTDDTSAALQNLVNNSPKTEDNLLNYEAKISKAWVDPDPDKTSDVFRDMIEGTVSGEIKAGDAVQRADKQIDAILNP